MFITKLQNQSARNAKVKMMGKDTTGYDHTSILQFALAAPQAACSRKKIIRLSATQARPETAVHAPGPFRMIPTPGMNGKPRAGRAARRSRSDCPL
jgi:hypothetical protein